MKLSHKLAKIARGEAYTSAKRVIGQWHPARLPLRLEAARLARSIDRERFAALRRKYEIPNPEDTPFKYFDLPHWMEINLRRVRELLLDHAKPARVLDLGCGVGYFLYLCQRYGHDVLGLDLDEFPHFGEMVDLLGVPRVVWRIEPFVPLPELGEKFDLITAHLICFNGHKSPALWGKAEWEFFLDDLARHLNPHARVALEFNLEPEGKPFSDELRNYFESRGAAIHTKRVNFAPLLPADGASAQVAK